MFLSPPRRRRVTDKTYDTDSIVLPDREFTLEELRFFDGTNPVPELDNEMAVYLAMNGTVFDVTLGKSFYGPGKGAKNGIV